MKKLLLVFSFVIAFAGLYDVNAQLRKIPPAVTDDLKAKFPEAEEVQWSSKLSSFLAEFYVGKVPYEVRYNSKGEWQSTDELIDKAQTPQEVLESHGKSKFSDWEIVNIFKRTVPNGGIQYRLYIRKSDLQKRFIFYDPSGKYIKEQTVL